MNKMLRNGAILIEDLNLYNHISDLLLAVLTQDAKVWDGFRQHNINGGQYVVIDNGIAYPVDTDNIPASYDDVVGLIESFGR